jgi:mono/diheme cytochrome c family protein
MSSRKAPNMKPRAFLIDLAIVAVLSGSWAAPGGAAAFELPAPATDDAEVGTTFLVSLGGKLYDDLWRVLDQSPPADANPAFPAGGLYSTRDSWRCATCHGWDYSGVEVGGRRFPSLTGLKGIDPAVIAERISDPRHPFPAKAISELSITLLAVFLSQGQYESRDFLDTKGGALGDPEAGQAIFEGACINCHQIDGRRYLNGERGDRSSLGWVVRNRPTQALHKIMNGVPGAEMLSLRFLADSQISDLFAYLQTLDPSER